MFSLTEMDTKKADWANLLLPDSIRNVYQDNDYRLHQKYD